MVSPIDYTLNVKNPLESAVQGYQFGAAIRDDRAAQAKAQADALAAQQLHAEIQAVLANPTAEGYARIAALDPKNSEAYSRSFATYDKGKKDALLGSGMKVLAALDSGNVAVAKTQLQTMADAARNSGDEQTAKAYEDAGAAAEINPDAARAVLGPMLAVTGGKDFIESYSKFRTQPADVAQAEAGAVTAGVTADFAQSKAILDLQEQGWKIKDLIASIDTKKSNAKIYALNAAISRETNALKRQELTLKMQEAVRARDTQIAERAAEASSVLAGIDMMNDTADRVLASPGLSSALGPLESRLPTLSEDTADAESLIENLGSQAFLTQVSQMKGTGALSDAEGKKISAALQSLNNSQSEKQFRTNVGIIKEVLTAARERTVKKFGIPPPPVESDIVGAEDLDALLNQYAPPGAAP